MYSTILLPHDGSEIADLAMPHAAFLAKESGAKVIILSVIDAIDTEIAFSSASTISPYMGKDIVEDIQKSENNVKKGLSKVVTRLKDKGIKDVEIVVEEGQAKDRIIDTAKKMNCDLIIMTTNGRRGLGRVLLGSVAEHVVRNSPVPVLVVRGK